MIRPFLSFALGLQLDGEAGILTGIGGLEEGQQPPGADHAGTAIGDERQGDAGEGQQIHRAEDIENTLEHQQGCGGAGGDGIEGRPPGLGTPHGENRQRDNARHRQKGDDQPPFFAQHPEHQVGIGGKNPFQPALSGAHAHETPGSGGAHGAGLLEAFAAGLFPHMAPHGKAFSDIGLEPQHHHARKGGAAGDEGQCGEIPRAEESNDQKGNEEDGGGAEVLHNGQTPQAEAGEQDEAIEVPLGKELIQCGGPGIDIGHFDQF